MGASGRVERLESAVAELLVRVDGMTEEQLQREPGTDDWSASEVLAHVGEYLAYWARQASEVARRNENGKPFGRTHDDPVRTAAVEEHAHDKLAEARGRIERGLAEAATLLRAIPDGSWSTRSATHARRGEMTIEQIVDQFILEHTDEHLAQAEKALAAKPSGE